MPFTIQPAKGAEFVNRENELQDMLTTLTDMNSHMGFAVYGKRRAGKTSIFKEVERLLKQEKDIVPVYFSIWDLVEKDVQEFVKELGIGILEAYKRYLPLEYKIRDLIELPINFLKKVIMKLKLSLELQDSISFILSFDKEKKVEFGKLVDDIFQLPEKLAKEAKKKSVLLLDEFPDIQDLKINGKKVGENIIRKIRTIQEDYKRTSLNISGSIRRTMETVAFSSSSAFYRQFIVKEIGPLSKESVKILMEKNLTKSTILDEGYKVLYSFTKGIPFYVQFLGRFLNKFTEKTITAKQIESVINEFLEQEGDLLFKEELEKMGDKESLIAVTMATKKLFSFSELSKALEGKITNLGRFISYLEEKDIVTKEKKGSYVFSDPIFQLWLEEKFKEA